MGTEIVLYINSVLRLDWPKMCVGNKRKKWLGDNSQKFSDTCQVKSTITVHYRVGTGTIVEEICELSPPFVVHSLSASCVVPRTTCSGSATTDSPSRCRNWRGPQQLCLMPVLFRDTWSWATMLRKSRDKESNRFQKVATDIMMCFRTNGWGTQFVLSVWNRVKPTQIPYFQNDCLQTRLLSQNVFHNRKQNSVRILSSKSPL